tara:strand:+ start:255 stop:1016 length:762 start_codon:yes stop_codon:yes gene_type:complete
MLTIVLPIGIRISGIQSLETAKVAIKNRAAIAFVFDQKSSKYIDPLKASEISEVLPKDVSIIGIFTDPSDEELTYCLNKINLRSIQLNGNESKDRVEFIKLWFSHYPLEAHLEPGQSLPPKYKKTKRFKRRIIKAISVNTKKDLEKISIYENIADGLLYDTSNSEIIDWSMFKEIFKWVNPLSNEYTGKEILPRFYGTISGKFNEENIVPALKTGTKGIDISSGLENEMGEISTEKIYSLFKYLNKNKLLYPI